jgi:lysophospholipase L1-like esterase
MNLFSWIIFPVFAAIKIISPIPDDTLIIYSDPKLPTVTFGNIQNSNKQLTSISTTPKPTPNQISNARKSVTIALLGDSMVDTLGPNAEELKTQIAVAYPKTSVTIYNYGVGATNVQYGYERLTRDYVYLGKQIPALLSQKPDIIVVESFAYNPLSYDSSSLDEYWLVLSKIVSLIKTSLPQSKIVIAATIAPNSRVFGDGAPAISFSNEDKSNRTGMIRKYLEDAIALAKNLKLPLADVYHASLDQSGEGNLKYINNGDHIHYSPEGRKLFAQKVAQAIIDNHLLDLN